MIPVIEWVSLAPVAIVALTGMVALIVHMIFGKSPAELTQKSTILGFLMALAVLLATAGNEKETFDGMLRMDRLAVIGQMLTVFSALIVALISPAYLDAKKIKLGEFYPMLAWATTGGMIVCATRHLLVLFVGIEILSISLYVLAGLNRGSKKSEESAIKYFLLGAFATGFLLYGIAMFYGATGSLDMSTTLTYWGSNVGNSRVLLALSFALIAVGLGFKCSLVPFHQWTPDVYEGAPLNVVAFMATGGKVGAFIALWNFADSFGHSAKFVSITIAALSVLSMIVGNVLAMGQKNIKRLLAYSSIANSGYVAVTAASVAAAFRLPQLTLMYFLLGYVLTTLGVFVILMLATKDGEEPTDIEDLNGLSSRSPFAAYSLAVFVLSLIGLGPVSGFLGKVFILRDALSAGLGWLAVVMVLNSIFGAFYYFGILRAVFSSGKGDARPIKVSMPQAVCLGLCVFGIIGSVLFYAPMLGYFAVR